MKLERNRPAFQASSTPATVAMTRSNTAAVDLTKRCRMAELKWQAEGNGCGYGSPFPAGSPHLQCYAARDCAVANSLRISRLKAGMSFGLRLVRRLRSTTVSWSTQAPPAFWMSVLSEGQDVSVRSLAAPASMIVQGPWHIAATGFLAVEERLYEGYCLCVHSECVRIHHPAGQQQRIQIIRLDRIDRDVHSHCFAPLLVVPAFNFATPQRYNLA